MSVLAVSIVITLLVLSVGAWGRLILSAGAQPLRETGRQLLVEPPADSLNERLMLVVFITVAVWLFVPAFLVGYSEQLAVRFGMNGLAVWPVVLNCISSTTLLLIAGPLSWLVLRNKPAPDAVWTTTTPLRMVRRIQSNAKAGVVAFVYAVLPVALVLLATHAIRTRDAQHSLLKLLTNHPGSATVAWVVLSAVILAPLVEELVFRVLLQGWLQTYLRPTLAIGVVALGFSAVHGWRDMMPLIPLATVLGVLFYVTRSYIAVVVTHSLFNATNVVLAVLSADSV